ncbi:MAG TPA: hypothetical protein DCQ29_14260 [Chitinophagaceae bacterium]|nr:hypothetical protein [Chitinophagaceae bacterium]
MKKLLFLSCIIVVMSVAAACGGSTAPDDAAYTTAENALDAGREFVDGCLKGKFEKSKFFMVPTPQNEDALNEMQRAYRDKPTEDRNQYREASINIGGVEQLNDTTVIIQYSNSYDKVARKLKVVKRNNSWLVDFAYTLSGNL